MAMLAGWRALRRVGLGRLGSGSRSKRWVSTSWSPVGAAFNVQPQPQHRREVGKKTVRGSPGLAELPCGARRGLRTSLPLQGSSPGAENAARNKSALEHVQSVEPWHAWLAEGGGGDFSPSTRLYPRHSVAWKAKLRETLAQGQRDASGHLASTLTRFSLPFKQDP